jgi:hypothetical protein
MPLSKPFTDYYFDLPPQLLYRIRLDPGLPLGLQPAPIVDFPHPRPSWSYAHPLGTQVAYRFEPEGLWLQLVRSSSEVQQSERTELLWNFSPVPPTMVACYISADFQLVTGSKAPDPFAPDFLGDQWAASVIVRDGDDPAVTDAKTTIVGATQQVIGSDQAFQPVMVTLGAGLATAVFPAAKDVAVQAKVAHDASVTFSLGTLIDCYTGLGRSHLKTSGGYYWENTFTHPFGPLPKPSKVITCAGCGVAFASKSGPGTAQVIVKEFRVQAWLPPVGTTVPVPPGNAGG